MVIWFVLTRLGEEHALPALAPRRHLEDVDDLALPFLIEDPGLDLLGDRLGGNVQPELLERVVAPGQDVHHEEGVEEGQETREDQDGPVERQQAHAAGPHGDQLAVGRQPAHGNQRAEQQRHRQRQDHDVRQRIQQQLADDRHRQPPADDHLRRGEQEPDEKDEGID
jgi:hypothetical protein